MPKILKNYVDRIRVTAVNNAPTMTQQHFKDECDVNYIVRNFLRTGVLPVTRGQGQYFDVSAATDYKDACNRIITVNDWFSNLPSATRAEFNNDPGILLEVLDRASPDDITRLKKFGFLSEKETPNSGSNPAPLVDIPVNNADDIGDNSGRSPNKEN